MLEILLVEDDPADAELVLRGLKKANLANPVVHAIDAAAALEALEERAAKGELFGLVLLDLNLPGMSGIALLERIKTDPFLAHTSVVVLTSTRQDPVIAKCYALGANGYSVKPVRLDSMHEMVKQLHLSWVMVSQAELSDAR